MHAPLFLKNRYSQNAVKICQTIQRIKNRTEKAVGGILSVKGKRIINTIHIQEQLAYLDLFRRNCRVIMGISWLSGDVDAQANLSSARGSGFGLKPFRAGWLCQASSLQPSSVCSQHSSQLSPLRLWSQTREQSNRYVAGEASKATNLL